MKPKPLDLNFDVDELLRNLRFLTSMRSKLYFKDGFIYAINLVRQRIKSACDFYRLFYGFNGMKELIVRVETGEIKLSEQRKRELYDFYLKYLKIFDKEKYYDLVNLIDKYNDWLFKLAFKNVFKENEGVD